MSDPAIEAVERAINGPVDGPVGAFALAAVQEALKPVRELHKPEHAAGSIWCSCRTGDPFLDHLWKNCPTAKLIFSSEELEHG